MTTDSAQSDFELCRALLWPVLFASKLSHDRGSQQIEICDLICGLYIAEPERIARYWPEWERLEELLYRECGMEEHRLVYWSEFLRNAVPDGRKSILGKLKVYSPQLAKVFARAALFAKTRKTSKQIEITIPDLLLAVSRERANKLCRKLVACGLDLNLLRRSRKWAT